MQIFEQKIEKLVIGIFKEFSGLSDKNKELLPKIITPGRYREKHFHPKKRRQYLTIGLKKGLFSLKFFLIFLSQIFSHFSLSHSIFFDFLKLYYSSGNSLFYFNKGPVPKL